MEYLLSSWCGDNARNSIQLRSIVSPISLDLPHNHFQVISEHNFVQITVYRGFRISGHSYNQSVRDILHEVKHRYRF